LAQAPSWTTARGSADRRDGCCAGARRARNASFISKIGRQALQQQTDIVTGILEDGIEKGVFRHLDARAVAEVMILALTVLDRLRRDGGSWKETSKRLDARGASYERIKRREAYERGKE